MFWLVLLVTEHAMGWPAFAAAHDGGSTALRGDGRGLGCRRARGPLLDLHAHHVRGGHAQRRRRGRGHRRVLLPGHHPAPRRAAVVPHGEPRPRRAATTGDLVFFLACLALAVVLGFMLNCVAFRTLPRPALHGRIGAASVATWVVPVVVAVVLLVDLWAELRKDGTGAGFAPFAVAAESLRLWALVYGAAAPLLALVLGSWLVMSRAALTTKLVVVPGSS